MELGEREEGGRAGGGGKGGVEGVEGVEGGGGGGGKGGGGVGGRAAECQVESRRQFTHRSSSSLTNLWFSFLFSFL